MAVDQESGDATFANVVVEVLSEGQSSKNTLTFPPGHRLPAGWNELYVYLCSSLQSAERWAYDRLYCGQSVLSEHGIHDCSWIHPGCGDVAEEEIQRKEGPPGERLCGPGQTPKCGEIPYSLRASAIFSPQYLLLNNISDILSILSYRACDGSNWWVSD